METQHTAYRRLRSVFGMASVFEIEVQIDRSVFGVGRSVFGIEVQ